MTTNDLQRARHVIVEAALLQERLLGKRSSITGDVGEIDAAIMLGMTDDEFRECNAGRLNTPGFDLTHNGIRYQVKAIRWSPKNAETGRTTTRIKDGGFDVLLLYVYNEDFTVRDFYRLTAEQWTTCQKSEDGRISFTTIPHFRIAA